MDNTEKLHEEHRRLQWHSHRGMLELDVLLLPFSEKCFLDLSEDDQKLYRRMIDCEDQDLFNWFMEKSKCPDADIQRMIETVLDYARNR